MNDHEMRQIAVPAPGASPTSPSLPNGTAENKVSDETSPDPPLLPVTAVRSVRSKLLMVRKTSISNADPPTISAGTLRVLKGNKLYVLLIFVPFALLAAPLGFTAAAVFVLCCLAILPLAGLLGDATEQVALHTNETLGGLLNATFGNATELIVAIFALQKGLLNVVQVSLLGSILSNTLLVLGCSCIAGGLTAAQAQMYYDAVKFNQVAAVANTTLLQIAILGLVVPTLMESIGQMTVADQVDLLLSRSIASSFLILYLFYVYFQLFTHRALFDDQKAERERAAAAARGEDDDDDELEEVLLSLNGGIAWLAVATVLIAVLSEALTGAIDEAATSFGLSETFVGFVIIPIVGNAAEHSTAITMAAKGKMDLSFGVALGSSTQIALFVIPLLVLLGWAIDQPLDLYFGVYETTITFLSTHIVSQVVADGETNWLEGVMLLFSYFIICLSFGFYHKA